MDWTAENRREFNFWWDPEAVHMVLHRAVAQNHRHHRRHLRQNRDQESDDCRNREIAQSCRRNIWQNMPTKNSCGTNSPRPPGSIPASSPRKPSSTWTWTTSHGRGYGNTLVWTAERSPVSASSSFTFPLELNLEKFDKMFIDLMTLPPAHILAAHAAGPVIRESRTRHDQANVDVVGIGSCTVDYFAIVPRLLGPEEKINADAHGNSRRRRHRE